MGTPQERIAASPRRDTARRGDAARRLASRLQQLGQLLLDVEALRPGVDRARAACAVFEAHLRLDIALAQRPGWHREEWSRRALPVLQKSLAGCPVGTTGGLHPHFGLLDLANDRAAWPRPLPAERWLSLQEGLWLRGSWAQQHRIALELRHDPATARGLLSDSSPLAKLAATGVFVIGRHRRFVGRVHDALAHFPASPELAVAAAHGGALSTFEDTLAQLSPTARKKLAPWWPVALEAVGDRMAAAARLAALSKPALRDKARLALAERALAVGDKHRARFHLDAIRNEDKRVALAARLAHGWLLDGVISRDLLAMTRHASTLEQALLAAEAEHVRGSASGMRPAMRRAKRLLSEVRVDRWPFPREGRTPPERLLRLHVALVLSGQPSSLVMQRRLRMAALASRFLRGELGSCLDRSRGGVRAEQLLEQADGHPLIHEALASVAIERRAAALRFASPLDTLGDPAPLREPAEIHAALVAGALVNDATVPNAATDPLRAAHDLGIALSPKAPKFKKRLVNAARACLRAPVVDGAGAAVRYRIRALTHLRSHPGTELVAAVLGRGRATNRASEDLLALLGRHEPRAARNLLWTRFALLTAGGERVATTLRSLERTEALPSPLVKAWILAHRALLGRDRIEASSWWCDYVDTWWRATGRPLTAPQLDLLGKTSHLWPSGKDTAMRHTVLAARALRALRNPAPALLKSEALPWACAIFDPFPERPMALKAWAGTLGRLVESVGGVDRDCVASLARVLRVDGRRLLRGLAPTSALAEPLDLGDGRHQLRYLTRQDDPLLLLRFGDAAPCCFSTDGGHFDGGMRNERWVHRIFKDPLSFCFAVERRGERFAGPVGFVFGGYATGDQGPVLLLNGVYLRRQKASLRFAILRRIEEAMVEPLGLKAVGIANKHGGSGPLPDGYERGTRRLVRHRALLTTNGSSLEQYVYDDLGGALNTPTEFDLHYRDVVAA